MFINKVSYKDKKTIIVNLFLAILLNTNNLLFINIP